MPTFYDTPTQVTLNMDDLMDTCPEIELFEAAGTETQGDLRVLKTKHIQAPQPSDHVWTQLEAGETVYQDSELTETL